MIHLTLPLPPSSNNAYINVPGKGRAPSTAHENWKLVASTIAKGQHKKAGSPILPAKKPYKLSIRVNIDHKSDIANREKLLTDMLVAAGILPDDCWVSELNIYRDRTINGVVVTAEAL